jgi:murein DD-endopeptidase MepM/ murein hydrolase activator NlpD
MRTSSRARRLLAVMLALALGVAGASSLSSDAHGQEPDALHLPADPVARIGAIDAAIATALSEIESATHGKARIEAELSGLGDGRANAGRQLRERTRALYRLTRAGVLPLAGGFEALLSHVARVERLERMVLRDAAAFRAIDDRAEALAVESTRLTDAIDAARGRIDRLTAQKTGLEDELRRLAIYSAAFGDIAGAPIGQTARAATSPPTFDPATGYGIRVVGPEPARDGAASSPFEALRGELALPLTAPRAIRDGRREDGTGLEIDGVRGAPVRAAAGGRVAFSDRHPAYGRLVILDHGGGFFTVYGGLARVDVEIGDQLSRGMEVGALEGEPLFFQVRRGTRSLDARSWLGI